jgi:tryptophan-rich sensory protein
MRSFLVWLAWVLLAFSATLPGAASPPDAWYETLAKPDWTPPGWVFPVVWTTLYVLMGTAAFLVWRKGRERGGSKGPLSVFLIQLALNAAWTPTFFGAREVLAALVILVALWLAIVATLLAFRRVSPAGAWLLAPYLAWVSVAAVLNFQIWRLNA